MMIVLGAYLITFITAFVLGLYDMKRALGVVTIKDFMFASILALMPVGNLGMIIVALYDTLNRSGLLYRKVF